MSRRAPFVRSPAEIKELIESFLFSTGTHTRGSESCRAFVTAGGEQWVLKYSSVLSSRFHRHYANLHSQVKFRLLRILRDSFAQNSSSVHVGRVTRNIQ
ncbi:hypothetical protein E2C01_063670 [Portunus trituberculatus]|uniref:Uncharacterized protein n=1 Tax=Portunus trituberculatus TaxID=210409 RepID=A0A5B7HIS5_PORTR|nr:hypothetical protein [Portunus trituberculatus]